MTDEPETIEVPVTRTARVALIGRAWYTTSRGFKLRDVDPATVIGKLSKFVVRPQHTSGLPFRSGIATVTGIEGDWVIADAYAIPAFCTGDYVYLVEE